MEELNTQTQQVNMQEPVNQQPVEQTTEQKPDFILSDTGEIQGDFSDWGINGEEDISSSINEPQEEASNQEQGYYTLEEMQQLGLEKLDPNKIPPELVPFYKSMQADYTRKTQALAQERKIVESLLDNALRNPAIAQQLMNDPNFVQTARQHPELAQKLQAVSQMTQPIDPVKVITEQAKRFVEQQVGEQFDEFNPEHIARFNLAVQQIYQAQQQQQSIAKKIEEIRASEPAFEEIDRLAEQKLLELPYKEAVRIQLAIQQGDMDTLLKFWEGVRREYYQNKVSQQQPGQQKTPEPPKVEKAGRGVDKAVSNVDISELGYLDDDAKAQMLIKLGLV